MVVVVVEGVLVVGELVFFSSVFIVDGVRTDDEREEDDEEFFRVNEVLDNKSLSDGVKIVEFFLVDNGSEELSSDETSKGSNVSEPNVG